MATSEIDIALDSMRNGIATNDARLAALLEEAQEIVADYDEYSNRYADQIAEIQALPGDAPDFVGSSPHEAVSQDRLLKMTAQFLASKDRAAAIAAIE